jgi:CHAD domain-containing protein
MLVANLRDAPFHHFRCFLDVQIDQKQRLSTRTVELPKLTTASSVPAEATANRQPRHGREQLLTTTGTQLHILRMCPKQQWRTNLPY